MTTIFLCRYDSSRSASKKKVRQILKKVCEFYRADVHEVLSRSRHSGLIWPRHVAMALSAANGLTTSTIGKAMNRERTSVSYAHKQVLDSCKVYPKLKKEVQELAREVKNEIG